MLRRIPPSGLVQTNAEDIKSKAMISESCQNCVIGLVFVFVKWTDARPSVSAEDSSCFKIHPVNLSLKLRVWNGWRKQVFKTACDICKAEFAEKPQANCTAPCNSVYLVPDSSSEPSLEAVNGSLNSTWLEDYDLGFVVYDTSLEHPPVKTERAFHKS